MRSCRKWIFVALVRLAMIPLSLPCLSATCCGCAVALGSSEAVCQNRGEGLVPALHGPPNLLAKGGIQAVDSSGSVAGTAEAPRRCCCRPANSDVKKAASAIHRSTGGRTKLISAICCALQAASTLNSSSTVGSRSSVSARAASCPTAAENCILLCRFLL